MDGGLAIDGRRIAGVRESKLHPHWAPFVQVIDPDAAATAAAAAGGRVAGRPSAPPAIVLVDPRGVPTVVSKESGVDMFAWHLLESTDLPASAAWLAAITGWTAPPTRGLWQADRQIGSIAAGTHDRWLGFVLVTDRLASRARAVALGATLETADVVAPGNGIYDLLVDPQGAAFCAFQGS